jgi:hypothetical protein
LWLVTNQFWAPPPPQLASTYVFVYCISYISIYVYSLLAGF